MQWVQLEYVFKGIFLGALAFAAFKLAGPDLADPRSAAGLALLGPVGGLLAALALSFLRRSGGLRVGLAGVILYRLLDHPALVALGLAGGMVGAAAWLCATPADYQTFGTLVGGGAGVGVLLGLVRLLPAGAVRLTAGLLVGAGLVGGGIAAREYGLVALVRTDVFAIVAVAGAALFSVMGFLARADEAEGEAAVVSALIGLAAFAWPLTPQMPYLSLLVPLVLYGVAAFGWLPQLRVLKLVLRGLGQLYMGRLRPALSLLNTARRLDPRSRLVMRSLRQLHLGVDLASVERDRSLLDLLDPVLCLDRAEALVLAPPGPEALPEAGRLLDLVLLRQPDLKAKVEYLRCLSDVHARRYDEAAARLADLLDPARWDPADPWRRSVLLAAWQLALDRHPELTARLGPAHLDREGRRMEAIAAVERHLADVPGDPEVWALKRMLYAGLSEAEYEAALPSGDGPLPEFAHEYALELGLALVGDKERWRRGTEYLRMAARGVPERCGTVFVELGKSADDPTRGADRTAARHYYEQGKRAGLAVGPQNLSNEERELFYGMLRWLSDEARSRGDLDAALENAELCLAGKHDELETLRALAELYERKGDPLTALLRTQEALCHRGKDPDLLARREKYYSWLTADEVAAAPEKVRQQLDAAYCVTQAKKLLTSTSLENLDWAWGLVQVARVLRPTAIEPQVLAGKLLLRRGERYEALQVLEDVRTTKPESFSGQEEEDAWYECCRVLGGLYLDELDRPDLAVEAFRDFRNSRNSGADTMYHLGRAYERVGDVPAAISAYRNVTAYEQHPLASDARSALYRLQSGVR
jgi:tetratricopeptide (TPR) repeat protein